ncbi:hypothetical protein [Nonomuraea phyllanthi]|uniref:hypothetical protein n=1 Tax=Nonomuraea phyllanthi TaxID=2219224 RepID=UPI00186B23E2|nr:hypothetical protein [Nonomuraea phyllanthi]
MPRHPLDDHTVEPLAALSAVASEGTSRKRAVWCWTAALPTDETAFALDASGRRHR